MVFPDFRYCMLTCSDVYHQEDVMKSRNLTNLRNTRRSIRYTYQLRHGSNTQFAGCHYYHALGTLYSDYLLLLIFIFILSFLHVTFLLRCLYTPRCSVYLIGPYVYSCQLRPCVRIILSSLRRGKFSIETYHSIVQQ